MERHGITRREAVGAGLVSAASVVLGRTGLAAETAATEKPAAKKIKVEMPNNADFYDAAGKFLPDKARQAYYDMFKRFRFPNPEPQQKLMWVQDFGLGDFVHAGMAGVFWINDKENKYFGHDIYLLPGQQIPEHAHMKTPDSLPKMEAWHCRYGKIWCFGEGEETKPCPVKLPESQESCRTCKHCQLVLPGEVYALNRPEAFHFMIAGPEGAIVSEYATYHDGAGLKFSNPKAKL